MTSYRFKKPLPLDKRARRTRAVLAVWDARPFDWRPGYHCIALAHAQARAMGHSLPPVPRLRGPADARAALHRMGHETIEDLLTAYFTPIAPARMLLGDLCAVPTEPEPGDPAPLSSVCIADGYGKLIGWDANDPSRLSRDIRNGMVFATAAWRLGA